MIACGVTLLVLAMLAGVSFGICIESAISDGRARRRCTDCIFSPPPVVELNRRRKP